MKIVFNNGDCSVMVVLFKEKRTVRSVMETFV